MDKLPSFTPSVCIDALDGNTPTNSCYQAGLCRPPCPLFTPTVVVVVAVDIPQCWSLSPHTRPYTRLENTKQARELYWLRQMDSFFPGLDRKNRRRQEKGDVYYQCKATTNTGRKRNSWIPSRPQPTAKDTSISTVRFSTDRTNERRTTNLWFVELDKKRKKCERTAEKEE